MAGPVGNRTPTSDLYIEDNLPRETEPSPRGDGWTRIGEVLPRVVEAIMDRAEAAKGPAYEPCECGCGRPTWGFVSWAIEFYCRDERAKFALEERLASVELSARDRLASLEMAERLLRPRPTGERKFLDLKVSA